MYKDIKRLVLYGIKHQLLEKEDYDYSINKLCDLLQIKEFVDHEIDIPVEEEPSTLLKPLLDYAVQEKIIQPDTILNKDLFEARIMDILIPRPSEVVSKFKELQKESSKKATKYFYNLSQKSNYIKTERTKKNIRWNSQTKYGNLDITINLSKPEKDPRDIINAKSNSSNEYPKCLLCKEHVGFSGNPGRVSHRIIPITLNQESFYLQYSPYVYYNEHCIVLLDQHIPMNVTEQTFTRLIDFVDQFPHYFLGSNAGLPIVGGSILAHEHYQGGNHNFPIEEAEVQQYREVDAVIIEKVRWPLSVIRLRSTNRQEIIKKAITLYKHWNQYTNEELDIIAHTDQPHNAITPIVRKRNEEYIIDITLRNNRTNNTHPLGIFHPHKEYHNIKKENIGLIEVMGLAVLPSRLENELKIVEEAVLKKESLPTDHIHYNWCNTLIKKYRNQPIKTFIQDEVADVFVKCLEDCGVFKQDQKSQTHFDDFIQGYVDVLNS